MAITDEITRLQTAKENIKAAIIEKGVEVGEETIDAYPAYIAQITGGGAGKLQAKSAVPTTEYQVITPDEGYDGLSRVLVANAPLEEITVTPSRDTQTVLPTGDNIGMTKVTVNGDENLYPSLIKKGVTIFGITGTFEGETTGGDGDDFSSLGYAIDIEARTAMSKGDRIVAVKNSSKSVASNANGWTFSVVSEDLTVGMGNPTFTMNTTGLTIYFMTETGAYEPVVMEVSNSQVQSMLNYKGATSVSGTTYLNEEGNRFIINFGGYFMFGYIYKDSKTISYSFDRSPYSDLDYYEEGHSDWNISSVSNIYLVGDYVMLMGSMTGIKNSNGSSVSRSGVFFYSVSTNGMSYMTFHSGTYTLTSKAWASSSVLLTAASSYNTSYSHTATLRKYTFIGSTVNVASIGYHRDSAYGTISGGLSKNGKYICAQYRYGSVSDTPQNCTLYALDVDTLTLTKIWGSKRIGDTEDLGAWAPIPANDGYYTMTPAGIYKEDGTKAFGTANNPTSGYFDPVRWISGGNTYSIVPTTNAEYLASKVGTFTMEEDKIYGIASENLTVGMRGTARGLFNSSTWKAADLQTKTITPSATSQTITPDDGYDGFSSVTISGDTDLVAENIKSGVQIFGVTGTLETATTETTE